MHISELHKAVERGEFAMKFVDGDGDVITIPCCVCTSYHAKGSTLNVKLLPSGEIRKIVRVTIIEVNGEEVYL